MLLLACGDSNALRGLLGLLRAIVDRAIAPHGPEHTRELPCESDDGNPFATRLDELLSPAFEGVLSIAKSEDCPRCLHEHDAGHSVSVFGDRSETALVRPSCRRLAGDEPEVGADRMRILETLR